MQPLDIYKKLPRKNCGKCPAGTCMAFAVQFLRRMASLSDCPELDEQSKQEIRDMFSDPGDWEEKRLHGLFKEISPVNFSDIASDIGGKNVEDFITIKYMGEEISVGHNDFKNALDIRDKLLILMYIKHGGKGALSGKWVAFRDLKDGMIRSGGFHGSCEVLLAKMFDQDKDKFIKRLLETGAEKVKGYPTEYSFVIYALPKLPLLVLLWPGDEEFDTACKVLLDSTATEFLDVEALLYLGMALVRNMKVPT